MPLAVSSCFCCFPKLLNPSLRERLVGHANNAEGTGAGAAPEQQQPATAVAAMQSSASLQPLLANGTSSSCPNLHMLEEHAAVQEEQQQQQQPPQKQAQLQLQQQEAKQSSANLNSKPVVRPLSSSQPEGSSSHDAPSMAKAEKKPLGQQVQIELKPAQANPFLGVQHITADRSFVKARPGA